MVTFVFLKTHYKCFMYTINEVPGEDSRHVHYQMIQGEIQTLIDQVSVAQQLVPITNTLRIACPGFRSCFRHAGLYLIVASVYRASCFTMI